MLIREYLGVSMIGRRVVLQWGSFILYPGDYGIFPDDGKWYAFTPNGLIANLASHEVTEHEDGTISVKPSILITNYKDEYWHGFLTKGVWREVA